MQILNFTDYARFRSTPAHAVAEVAASLAPNTDRWAALHTESHTAEVVSMTSGEVEFFDDLQLRFAYPTLHLRHP